MRPLRLPSRLAALLALAPADRGVLRRLYRRDRLDDLDLVHRLAHAAELGLRRPAPVRALFANERWLVSVHNLVIFGVLFVAVCLALGFLLAVAIDQKVRAENLLRSVFLYPYSMSFVVTGLVWQWLLNPTYGHREAGARLGLRRRSASTGSCGRTW